MSLAGPTFRSNSPSNPVSSMRRFPLPLSSAILAVGLHFAAVGAQTQSGPRIPPGADFVLRNFVFSTGDTMPELRIHYIALGAPRRDSKGTVRNAVIVLHGTTGSGGGFTSRTFGAGRAVQ